MSNDDELRFRLVIICVSDNQWMELERRAARDGVTVEEYARRVVLGIDRLP